MQHQVEFQPLYAPISVSRIRSTKQVASVIYSDIDSIIVQQAPGMLFRQIQQWDGVKYRY